MNAQRMDANLICLFLTSILTYVQPLPLVLTLATTAARAMPNLDPTSTESSSSATPSDEINSSALDSVSVASGNSSPLSSGRNQWRFILDEKLSLGMSAYAGPSESSRKKNLFLLGFDFQDPVTPSDINHFGLSISNTPNPRLYVARESFLRNYWRYLKSWSFFLQLEVDSKQQLGSLLATHYYMAGAGLNLSWSPQWGCSINIYPFSGRDAAGEIRLNYLVKTL